MRTGKHFTLVELLVAMGVLSIFMLGMIRFFTVTQNVMNTSSNKNDLYSSARIVLDMIASDIQCLYVDQDQVNAVFFAPNVGDDDENANLRMATRRTDYLSGAQSNVASVSYDYDAEKLCLYLTAYGDNSEGWNVGADMGSISGSNNNFSNFNKDDAVELLNGVTGFSVKCMEYDAGNNSFKELDAGAIYNDKRLPDMVQITLNLVDQTTMKRMQGILGDDTDLTLENIENNEVAKRLLEENERTFTRIIPVDRGTF